MSKLAHLFSSVLGIREDMITPATSPKNTPAWDSLNAIILLTEIENAFGIKFGYDEAMGIKDFGEVQALLAAKGKDPHE